MCLPSCTVVQLQLTAMLTEGKLSKYPPSHDKLQPCRVSLTMSSPCSKAGRLPLHEPGSNLCLTIAIFRFSPRTQTASALPTTSTLQQPISGGGAVSGLCPRLYSPHVRLSCRVQSVTMANLDGSEALNSLCLAHGVQGISKVVKGKACPGHCLPWQQRAGFEDVQGADVYKAQFVTNEPQKHGLVAFAESIDRLIVKLYNIPNKFQLPDCLSFTLRGPQCPLCMKLLG